MAKWTSVTTLLFYSPTYVFWPPTVPAGQTITMEWTQDWEDTVTTFANIIIMWGGEDDDERIIEFRHENPDAKLMWFNAGLSAGAVAVAHKREGMWGEWGT